MIPAPRLRVSGSLSTVDFAVGGVGNSSSKKYTKFTRPPTYSGLDRTLFRLPRDCPDEMQHCCLRRTKGYFEDLDGQKSFLKFDNILTYHF